MSRLLIAIVFALLVNQSATGQHGVIREYAALAPRADATPLRPLLDVPLTDVSIALGHDRAYYMTGSAVVGEAAAFSKSVTIWRSTDMKQWSKLREIAIEGKAVQSPEIHYLQKRYWLTLGVEGGGTELLAFGATDIAKGAYKRAKITGTGSDPSLFLDDDGTWYWVMGAGEVAKMKADPMQGLAGPARLVIQPLPGPLKSIGVRGAFLTKIKGFYHLFVGERLLRHGELGRTGLPGGADDTFVAVSGRPDSGYETKRYLAFPHAGQTTVFRALDGELHATFSCTDTRGIFRLKPGAFRVELVEATKAVWPIGFDFDKPDPPVKYRPAGIMVRPDTAHVYEGGAGLAKPVPMDPVPGQRAAFPWIRDTSIIRGHDGMYYMTGTSGNMDAVHLWRSPDLKRFEYWKPALRLDTTNKDMWYNQAPGRLLWAPEIHYLNGNYWIAWCVNLKLGMSLWKSSTGKPDGPYVPAYEGNRAFLSPNIDSSLFVDDDGTPYFVWQGRYIRKLNKEMSDFAGERVELMTVDGEQVGYEGIFLRKIGPWYVVLAAEWNGGGNREDGTYDMMYSVSKNLLGPYTRRRVGVPHGGHSTLFQNGAGQWHLAFFGNDRSAPFRAMPGVVALDVRDTGDDLVIRPALESGARTTVSIAGDGFLINGRPTYEGRTWNGHRVEGLLFNNRVVQGTFDDLNPETASRWVYPDTGKWDPERNVREFLAAMPEWKRHGVLAFTVNFQGGSPEGYSKGQPWENHPFNADGSLRPAFMDRMKRILDEADRLGMVPIVGYFYFGQSRRLQTDENVLRATDKLTQWLLAGGWKNLLVEVNNESNPGYVPPILRPDRVHELIARVRDTKDASGRRLLVGTSFPVKAMPRVAVVNASDFVLLHGNAFKASAELVHKIRATRALNPARVIPVLVNEDDHNDFEAPDGRLTSCLVERVGWGWFDWRRSGEAFDEGYQSVPVNWKISSDRKRRFHARVAEITGAATR